MRFRLRTMFLVTTIVAITTFAFTLGMAEGVVVLVFFAMIFGSSKKKEGWISSVVLVTVVVGVGLLSRYFMRTDLGHPGFGKTACIEIYFTGSAQKRQEEVFGFLSSELPYGETGAFHMSRASAVPFFRSGYIALHVDKEKLADIEAKVRRMIRESFPNLTMSIESHSISDTKD